MTNRKPEDWVRPEIRALSAYHVPDSTGLIKLDAMENPYPWPSTLVREWQRELKGITVNRYPDPQARALKDKLRETMRIPASAGLLLGNGSDEIIQMLVMAVGGPWRTVLAPEPSFTMFRIITTLCGSVYQGAPLRAADFTLDEDAMCAAIRRHKPALIFIANPNNPTGNRFDPKAIRAVIEAAPGLIVIDEAYYPFSDGSCLEWLDEYEHLLIMRTVSKLGLAGLRLGLIAGGQGWLNELEKTRLPYNINVLTQVSAEFALAHARVFAGQAARIRTARAKLEEALRQIPGLTVYPSEANFILFRTPAGRAGSIHDTLKSAGVLIKNLDGSHPALADCLRVTIGKPDENQAFM
ncbi:MAG: histidinol-phosphate transaminase, partial [Nevskiales bacterium]